MRYLCCCFSSFLMLLAIVWQAVDAYAQGESGFKYLEVTVVDPDGKPLADVPVDIRIDGAEFPMPTDEDGIVAFNVPTGDKTRLRLKVSHAGYAALGASWNSGEELPEQYTIQMQKGTTIGGIIQDEQGRPIEGVKIEAHLSTDYAMQGGGKLHSILGGVIATTDRKGRWRNDSAPAKRIEIVTDFIHPDYAHDNVLGYRAGNWEQLHSLKHVVVLRKGIELLGQVLDPEGLPVVGAKVTLSKGRYYSDEKATTTDEEGKYRLTNVKPENTTVTVLSSDWAPEMKTADAKVGMEPVDFRLLPGKTVRFRIVDQAGQPVGGVKITPNEWRGSEILPQSKTRSNAEGIWEWGLAPAGKIQYRIYKKGFMSTGVPDIEPRKDFHEVTLPPEVVFTGKVTDAKTGQPIEQFQVVEGIYWRTSDNDVVWQQQRKELGKDGRYRVAYNSGYAGFKVKIEADGYRPKASRLVAIDEGEVNIDLELEAGAGPSGIVKLPNGQPAVGAEVLMATQRRSGISIVNGEHTPYGNSISTTTDAEGRFQLPITEGYFVIVCLHDEGWAKSKTQEPLASDLELTLEPWARVEGVVRQGKEILPNAQVNLHFSRQFVRDRSDIHWQNDIRVNWNYSVQTDEKGAFVFARAQSGEATLYRMISYDPKTGRSLGSFSSHAQPCKLVAGETTHVQIGGTGRAVAGRLVAPENFTGDIPWLRGKVNLQYQPENLGLEEGQKKLHQQYATPVKADESFEISDVLPGKYWLSAIVYQPRIGQNSPRKELGRLLKATVIIPAGEETQPFDLGEHVLLIIE